MTTFTARNGITIRVSDNDKTLEWTSKSDRWYYVGETVSEGAEPGFTSDSRLADALREYFQHERDEALGRWRWPEKPEWVVYAERPGFAAYNGADLLVINELYGASMEYSRALDDGTEYVEEDEKAALAARAYFEAHPEPKPWDDAKVDEIWAVTLHGTEKPCRVVKPAFHDDIPIAFLPIDLRGATWFIPSPSITAARRIWPEDAS